MFYSSDILSRRKTGLGIVWLAATIGDRSMIRRLSRRDILGVNVPRTCNSVRTPREPMALRLSSQLLYGIVKIYNHQVELCFQDVQTTILNLRKQFTSLIGPEEPNIDMTKPTKSLEAITFQLDMSFFTLDFHPMTTGFFEAIALEEARAGTPVGIMEGFRTPTPTRFVAPEERITLPRRAFEEPQEVGVARRFVGEGIEMEEEAFPTFPEAYEEEGFEPLDLGLEAIAFPEAEEEGLELPPERRRRLTEVAEAVVEGPLLEWPELEDRLAAEATRLELEGIPGVVPARRRREEEEVEVEDLLRAAPRQRRRPIEARLQVFEDPITELSDDQLRSARSDYPTRMMNLRSEQIQRRSVREAEITAHAMIFGPPAGMAQHPSLVELWQVTIGAQFRHIEATFREMRAEATLIPSPPGPPTPPPPSPLFPLEEEVPEIGVARAAAPAAELPAELARLAARESLPWNLYMERRRRSSMMPSVSYERAAFEREVTPGRAREISIETPTGLRRVPRESPLFPAAAPSPSITAGYEEGYYPPAPETPSLIYAPSPSLERIRIGATPFEAEAELRRSPTPPSQIFEEDLDEETRNFYQYSQSIRDELADPRFLFFSDLAPVPSSTPEVAAQAFYHTLALASAGRFKVKQDVPYEQIQITIVAS